MHALRASRSRAPGGNEYGMASFWEGVLNKNSIQLVRSLRSIISGTGAALGSCSWSIEINFSPDYNTVPDSILFQNGLSPALNLPRAELSAFFFRSHCSIFFIQFYSHPLILHNLERVSNMILIEIGPLRVFPGITIKKIVYVWAERWDWINLLN